eukprot:scaffold244680_cov31-Tisochrysis_lutea.AAC.2
MHGTCMRIINLWQTWAAITARIRGGSSRSNAATYSQRGFCSLPPGPGAFKAKKPGLIHGAVRSATPPWNRAQTFLSILMKTNTYCGQASSTSININNDIMTK